MNKITTDNISDILLMMKISGSFPEYINELNLNDFLVHIMDILYLKGKKVSLTYNKNKVFVASVANSIYPIGNTDKEAINFI